MTGPDGDGLGRQLHSRRLTCVFAYFIFVFSPARPVGRRGRRGSVRVRGPAGNARGSESRACVPPRRGPRPRARGQNRRGPALGGP
eukprot:4019086-Prymnesium_polylepis.1